MADCRSLVQIKGSFVYRASHPGALQARSSSSLAAIPLEQRHNQGLWQVLSGLAVLVLYPFCQA